MAAVLQDEIAGGHIGNIVHVNDIAAMAAEKILGQFLLQFHKAAVGGIGSSAGVEDGFPAKHFDILDLPQQDLDALPLVCNFNGLGQGRNIIQAPVHGLVQLALGIGLEQVARRIDPIAFQGMVLAGGGKHQLAPCILLPDSLGSLHAGEGRHINIQK